MSEPTRYRVANNQAQLTLGGNILVVDPSGPLVEYADYASLLADYNKTEEHNEALCERLQDLNSEVHTASCHNANLYKENARLKAEVERLTFEPLSYLDDQGEWMPRHTHLAAVERLKAEVERLRKAGDEMVNRIRWFERPFKSVAKCPEIEAWNAAKEGKQS